MCLHITECSLASDKIVGLLHRCYAENGDGQNPTKDSSRNHAQTGQTEGEVVDSITLYTCTFTPPILRFRQSGPSRRNLWPHYNNSNKYAPLRRVHRKLTRDDYLRFILSRMRKELDLPTRLNLEGAIKLKCAERLYNRQKLRYYYDTRL